METNSTGSAGFDHEGELLISLVAYHGDMEVLADTIASLRDAIAMARDARLIGNAELVVVDNRESLQTPGDVEALLNRLQPCAFRIIRPGRNLGYGKGHNLAINAADKGFHLILNPDVIMDKRAISEALRYLRDHPGAGMVTPRAFDAAGRRQYLCKQYPSVMDLFIRGLLPQGMAARYFGRRMARYEMRGCTEDQLNDRIRITGGCFMFCRSRALAAAGGFSPDYFLYFEDFDLSLRMVEAGWKIAYVPAVVITHYGGQAARKGVAHLYQFAKSAARFFMMHGWKLF